jgi:hypothetical protein
MSAVELFEPERVEAPAEDRDKAPSCLLCDRSVSESHQWLCAVHEAEDRAEARARSLARTVPR